MSQWSVPSPNQKKPLENTPEENTSQMADRFHEDEPKIEALYDITQDEISKMEICFKEIGTESITQELCQELATSFSCSSARAGKSTIQWEQVQNWFQNKANEMPVDDTSLAIVPLEGAADTTISSSATKSQALKGEKTHALSELAFEAKSVRDDAWYDVCSFLTYRYVLSGELEVRVRFSGFGHDNDEWVNVKWGVRERSIPLEATECYKVNVGDPVLCFQEREDQAIYCDARISNIQRRIHDIKGCRCIFFVRYEHDNTEERVQLSRICCRPANNIKP